jgi:hypothetical protein
MYVSFLPNVVWRRSCLRDHLAIASLWVHVSTRQADNEETFLPHYAHRVAPIALRPRPFAIRAIETCLRPLPFSLPKLRSSDNICRHTLAAQRLDGSPCSGKSMHWNDNHRRPRKAMSAAQ